MKVLIFENNLLWSARLAQGVKALGHEAVVISKAETEYPTGDLAIVNLANPTFDLASLVPELAAAGVHTVGHAGHKETALWERAKELPLNQMVSHSTLTHKLDQVLAAIPPTAQNSLRQTP